MKYQVGIKIYNSFEVEANSEEEAEEIVRELSIESTLRDSDYNITYVDKIKPSMQSTALNKVFAPMTDRIYSDDEHGNSL